MKKQNECLNFFKGLACIFVVILHVRFPVEKIDGPIQCIARFAVPLFFMISGYYCSFGDEKEHIQKLPRKIKHILRICIVSFIFWIIIQYSVCFMGNGQHDIVALTKSMFSFTSLIRLIILNDDPVISILWFLLALLYCYIIYYCCALMKITRVLPLLIIPFLSVHFCLGNIGNGLFGMSIDVEYYRNAWFMGIPLFMIGHEIRNKQEYIMEKVNGNIAMLFIFGGTVLSLIEWNIVGGRQQMYIGSILTAVGMIIYSSWNFKLKVNRFIVFIGQKCSMYVYVIHICVGILLDKVAKFIGLASNHIYLWFKPICVILISVLASVIIVKGTDRIKLLKVFSLN